MLKRYSIWLLTTFILFFAGCSDEYYNFNNKGEDLFEEGLTVCVPRLAETRAVPEGMTASELQLHTLTLFLYRYENNSFKELIVKQLKDDRNAVKVTPEYEAYNISDLPQGEYKVYVVANIFNSESEDSLKDTYSNGTGNQEGEVKLLKMDYDFVQEYFGYDKEEGNVKGLPMSCLHSDLRTSTEGEGLNDKMFSFTGKETLYADMTFCLAKVTVAVEGPTENIDVEKVSLSNYLKKFTLFEGCTPLQPIEVSESSISVEDQNLVYVTETNGQNDPKLTVEYEDKKVSFELGEKNSSGHYDLLRGHHYEYVIKRNGTIELKVKEWSPILLTTEINAPFELVVDLPESRIDTLESGKKYSFAYRTDAETLDIVVPKFYSELTKTTVDFYNSTIEDGKITVWLNNDVSLGEYRKLPPEEKEKLRYFHIKANNLMKRINIGHVVANPSFTVDPQNIIIDLRELIGGGFSDYRYSISYSSNFGKVTADWADAEWEGAEGEKKKVSSLDNVFSVISSTARTGTDNIAIYHLSDGETDFWNTRWTLTVTYKVIAENADDEEMLQQLKDNGEDVKKVTFTVIPYSSTYKIHFKSLEGWSLPHIYVYQCLEMPRDLLGTNKAFRAKTVGGTSGDSPTAALQYCFSSGFCFKGWKGYGGPDNNDPNASGAMDSNGFFYFSSKDYAPNTGDVGASTLNTARYMWYNFNAAHYATLKRAGQKKCTTDQCNTDWNPDVDNSEYWARLWPGVVMYDEGNGWWSYELSGVAEPGKTLIMFADGHSGDKIHRFPEDAYVGVPLFDYEDKEGWFLHKGGKTNYVNNRFYDDNPIDKPIDQPEVKKATYRFYWDYSSTNNGLNLYYNGDSNNEAWKPVNATYSGSGKQTAGDGFFNKDSNGNVYWEVSVEETKCPKVVYWAGYNSDANGKNVTISNFIADKDGVPSVYLNFSKGTATYGGPVDVYTLYWRRDKDGMMMDTFYVVEYAGDGNVSTHKTSKQTTINGVTYNYVELGKNFTSGKFLIKDGDLDINGGWDDARQTDDFILNTTNFSNRECTVVIGDRSNSKYPVSISNQRPSVRKKSYSSKKRLGK